MKFANERKGGKNYTVRVTDTREGDAVDTVHVKAMDPRRAKAAAIAACAHRVIDATRLHAHSPQRA